MTAVHRILTELNENAQIINKLVAQQKRLNIIKTTQASSETLEFLVENIRDIIAKRIYEVYAYNHNRQGIDPEEIINTLCDNIHIDTEKQEILISFDLSRTPTQDEEKEPVYFLREQRKNTRQTEIHDANLQWQLPIKGLKEDEFYYKNITKDIDDFLNTKFKQYIEQQVRRRK